VRLGALAASRNKVLIEFQGESLLERHVRLLTWLNVSLIYIVTGHLREQLQCLLPRLRTQYHVEVLELYNPHFTEGSALSMHASLPALANVTDNVLLMDGDVLYDGRMLERLVHSAHRTALLIDRHYSTADDDPVLVPVQNGRAFEFQKKWKGAAEVIGESIGFFKVHPADLPLLVQETEKRHTGAGRSESYDEIIRAMVRAGVFMVEDVTGLPWTEIDFPQDVYHAAKHVLPLLRD
jgi:choline kinase